MKRLLVGFSLVLIMISSCKKDSGFNPDPEWRFFEVAIRNASTDDWRDSAFVVATKDAALLQKIEAQLALPEADRKKIVAGKLARGNGGYNKNAGHSFKWRIQEDDWDIVDLTIELSDGRPYSDVDVNIDYW